MARAVSLSRTIACDTFIQVLEHGKSPDEVLEAFYREHTNIQRKEKNFIKEILFGSLRWMGKLYWILQHTSKRDLDKSSPEIRAALLIGTYQIYYMDKVPDRAAVNESVEYIRSKGQSSACSFVNGILRQIARRAEYFTKPDQDKFPADYLSIQFAYPKWLMTKWLKQFKYEQLLKMLPLNNEPPPISIRINTMKLSHDDHKVFISDMLKFEKTHIEKRPLRNAYRLKSSPQLGKDSIFSKGMYTIQDEAAQLIGCLLEPDPEQNPKQRIVDVCAGPGGKLSHIYELSKGKAILFALEKHPVQFEKMQQTMQRLGHTNYEAISTDLLDWNPDEPFDKILLDAPCSGLGVLKRHPEGKWLKDQTLVERMAELQRKMLTHCFKHLKPGGELVYSVCSHEPEESMDQLAWIKKTWKDATEIISPAHRLPPYYKKYVTRENILLIYSGNNDGMDGFAAFIIKKNS